MIADLQRPVAWATIRQRVCQEEIKIVAHKSGKSERVDKIVQALQPLAIPISDLTPDAANARKHNTRNLDAIAASLRQFGQRKPIVAQRVNDALIVRAGNGTREAAISLGWTHIAAVVIEEDSTSATAYALADNRTAELAEWDNEVLASLLTSFDDDTRELTGFDDSEVKELLKTIGADDNSTSGGNTDPDDTPEPPVEPVTRTGDIWLMGAHRLMCGDSAIADDVARLMHGQRAHCVFTDPPYGVAIGAKNRMLNSFQRAGRNLTDITDDALSPEELKGRLQPAFSLLRTEIMADDCTLFMSAPQGGELGMMMIMMRDAGLPARHVLIWKKNQPTFSMGRLDYDYAHEPILLTWGKRHKRPMLGTHRTSVWEIDRPRASVEHPTMKPVALYVNAYLNNSDSGDNVADIYCGSGTALIAAQQTNRRAFGMEIEPRYCDVAVHRWCEFTGLDATRESDRASFRELTGMGAING